MARDSRCLWDRHRATPPEADPPRNGMLKDSRYDAAAENHRSTGDNCESDPAAQLAALFGVGRFSTID